MIWRQGFHRLGLFLTASVFIGLSGSALAAAATPYTSFKIANGLEVIAMESHKVPLATIVLCSKAGAMTETVDINGLTHLWEHMFFKGNKRLGNQEAFNKRIRQLGIVYNGDTSAEMVRYYFTLPSAYLDQGLEFMADAIMTPLLESSELERERRVVLNEWDRNASSPGFDMWRLRRRMVYGEESYRRDPLGERSVIENANREQLLRIKDEVFVPSNSALLVAGDFDPKSLQAAIEKHFSSWQGPASWQPPKIPEFASFPTGNAEIVMTKADASNLNLSLIWQGPKARTEQDDSYAADILISLLSHRSGKFYQKYVDSGLTFQSGLGYHTQSKAGEIMLYGLISPDKYQKVKELFRKEPAEWLKDDYFGQEQLEDVRRSLKISHKFDLNKPTDYIKTLAFWWAVTGLDYNRDYLTNLARIDLKDVRAFVLKYIIDKPFIASVLLSPEDAAKASLKDNAAPLLAKYFPAPKLQKE